MRDYLENAGNVFPLLQFSFLLNVTSSIFRTPGRIPSILLVFFIVIIIIFIVIVIFIFNVIIILIVIVTVVVTLSKLKPKALIPLREEK